MSDFLHHLLRVALTVGVLSIAVAVFLAVLAYGMLLIYVGHFWLGTGLLCGLAILLVAGVTFEG